jgi:phosphohistidine phosphatase SixA
MRLSPGMLARRLDLFRTAAARCVVLLLALSLVASEAAPAETHLLDALRSGGYVLYFRHTATDFGQNDEKMTGYEDCANQRNLTDAGRADARAIGAAIRSLGIPVGEVLASPFCRTRETAELIFGRYTVSPAVRGGPASAEAGRYADLKLLLARPTPAKVNIAIASHGNPFVAVVGTPYLAEGEAAVIEPMGSAGFRVVARIKKDEWMGLK